MKRVLLLAGTSEARVFAEQMIPGAKLIASLAGATGDPHSYACETRVGGFGGAQGLADYLLHEDIAAVIDATHPFATQISANAAIAAQQNQLPLLILRRPPWPLEANWSEFELLTDAIAALPAGAAVFATTGRMGVDAIANRKDVRFFLRSIEDPGALPDHIISVRGRPPFSVEREASLMMENGITHLLTKNAGGKRPAKLRAAENLGIPVFSITMPPAPPAIKTASGIPEILEWLAAVLASGER